MKSQVVVFAILCHTCWSTVTWVQHPSWDLPYTLGNRTYMTAREAPRQTVSLVSSDCPIQQSSTSCLALFLNVSLPSSISWQPNQATPRTVDWTPSSSIFNLKSHSIIFFGTTTTSFSSVMLTVNVQTGWISSQEWNTTGSCAVYDPTNDQVFVLGGKAIGFGITPMFIYDFTLNSSRQINAHFRPPPLSYPACALFGRGTSKVIYWFGGVVIFNGERPQIGIHRLNVTSEEWTRLNVTLEKNPLCTRLTALPINTSVFLVCNDGTVQVFDTKTESIRSTTKIPLSRFFGESDSVIATDVSYSEKGFLCQRIFACRTVSRACYLSSCVDGRGSMTSTTLSPSTNTTFSTTSVPSNFSTTRSSTTSVPDTTTTENWNTTSTPGGASSSTTISPSRTSTSIPTQTTTSTASGQSSPGGKSSKVSERLIIYVLLGVVLACFICGCVGYVLYYRERKKSVAPLDLHLNDMGEGLLISDGTLEGIYMKTGKKEKKEENDDL